MIRSAVELSRAREWWEHKLALLAGLGYATGLAGDASLLDVADTIALVLLAVAVAAVYVSVLNDLTDREDDRAAGKRNRLAAHPAWVGPVAVAACVLAGSAIGGAAWGDDRDTLAIYAGIWIAFTLYSVPPLRLKGRGFFGVCVDAAGAHVFPAILMVSAVGANTPDHPLGFWPAAVMVWASALGIRGALWHQLQDAAADERTQTGTFARRHPAGARRVGVMFAFPLELAALGAMLVLAANPVALVLLVVYGLLSWQSTRRGAAVTVVGAGGYYRIAMHSYYVVFFPVAYLALAVWRSPPDCLVLAGHLLVFPREVWEALHDAYIWLR